MQYFGYRGSRPDHAREYRARGHRDADLFANELGMGLNYKNDLQAKKDVIDPSGDAHSVKSGKKKWQIFLYRRSRFETDDGFQALNGIGALLIHCIDVFPPNFDDYEGSKEEAKERLRTPMREIKDRLQRKALLRAFLMKSIFNGGEVNYLTIYDNDIFHVYLNEDVIEVMGNAFVVENSQARNRNQTPEQKVLFRYKNRNVGELEMRNDSRQHYGEVRFNMNKEPCVSMLRDFIIDSRIYSPKIISYGNAITKFGNW